MITYHTFCRPFQEFGGAALLTERFGFTPTIESCTLSRIRALRWVRPSSLLSEQSLCLEDTNVIACSYRRLGKILKRKTPLLSIHGLAKLLELSTTSTVSLRQVAMVSLEETTPKMNFIIINPRAFGDLVCDLGLWEGSNHSMINLLSFMLELVSTENPYRKQNLIILFKKVKLVPIICRYVIPK